MTDLQILAENLRQSAEKIVCFVSHRQAAEYMLKAAEALDRLAHFEPDIEAVRGEE